MEENQLTCVSITFTGTLNQHFLPVNAPFKTEYAFFVSIRRHIKKKKSVRNNTETPPERKLDHCVNAAGESLSRYNQYNI